MKFIFISLFVVISAHARAQNKMSHDDSLLVGSWKGTSTCQVKPSPCKDEVNVYHITKGSKPNTYHIVANKVVDEQEQTMGESDFSFDAINKTLTWRDDRYKTTVNLTIIESRIEGTLLHQGQLYRIINLSKEGNR